MSFTADIDELVETDVAGLTGDIGGFERVRLGDVAKIINGYPFDAKLFSREQGAPLLRIRDIRNTATDTSYSGPIPDGYWVEAGDLLIGMDGDFNSARWRGPRALLNQRVCKVVPNEAKLHVGFLHHLLPGYLQLINRNTPSITVKHLSSRTIASLPIPLPPLADQERIAAKLDAIHERAAACRAHLERSRELLQQLRRSVLTAAVTGELTREWREARGIGMEGWQKIQCDDAQVLSAFRFPESWRVVRLREIADIKAGITKDANKQHEGYDEIPYLRVANVQRGRLDLAEVKTIKVPKDKRDALLLAVGDVLYNEGGDLDKLGRGWVWEGQLPICTHQNHVYRARLSFAGDSPYFISWYSNTLGHLYFVIHGKQTTNLASISRRVLSELPVVLPCAAEQEEIVRLCNATLRRVDSMNVRVDAALARTADAVASGLATAFRGTM